MNVVRFIIIFGTIWPNVILWRCGVGGWSCLKLITGGFRR
jgi:hypothetical protein